ncbi:Hydrocephalus-inducing protein-like protein [Larimichthys crocea]|uniref:Uncharacterized protein n=1 Tax=Larimichthys crocea TaxID=215358 RepID=A0ACD3QE71_LARCR|nr:Hydrocephalus-inducing protein-like protein [Larimichthys crocea]
MGSSVSRSVGRPSLGTQGERMRDKERKRDVCLHDTSKMTAKKNCKVVLEDKPRRVTPSVYTLEMLQSTEERLANTTEVHLPRVLEALCLVDMGQPLFQPYPSELVFQNFTPAQTYKLCLLLLNNDKISRPVKLEQQHSEYFHVDGPHEPGGKISPGLSATFTVSFTPLDNKDYHHRLVFVTERERFEVPIRAIGPRAILDFRDEFHLPVCPVKASTEKTQLGPQHWKQQGQVHTTHTEVRVSTG